MVSYFKTQWFRLLCAIACLVIALAFIFSPAPDISTLEGTNEALDTMFASTGWLISFFVWLGLSIVDWYGERINVLEAKAKKYDALEKKVDALQELLETEREYSDHLNQRIDSLVHEIKELRKYGN
jgi:hypothetical protein